jgi:hypothetical protein
MGETEGKRPFGRTNPGWEAENEEGLWQKSLDWINWLRTETRGRKLLR